MNIGTVGRARPLVDTSDRPDQPGLLDRFGRTAHDLRVSVTEKCSLRCTYCMPEEGLPAIARRDLLTPAEIGRLVGIAARDLGVQEVRFTGGEPLMRADLAEIIRLSSAVATARVSGLQLWPQRDNIGLFLNIYTSQTLPSLRTRQGQVYHSAGQFRGCGLRRVPKTRGHLLPGKPADLFAIGA